MQASMGTAKTTSKVFDKGPLSAASSFFHEVDEDHVAETSWPKIAYIIVANFLGAGVLSIPFAASQLGYVLFVAFLTAVYLASLLSGKAFYAAFQALPKSRALSDIGKACYGNCGETTVRFFQYLYMSLVLIILHLTVLYGVLFSTRRRRRAAPRSARFRWDASSRAYAWSSTRSLWRRP